MGGGPVEGGPPLHVHQADVRSELGDHLNLVQAAVGAGPVQGGSLVHIQNVDVIFG